MGRHYHGLLRSKLCTRRLRPRGLRLPHAPITPRSHTLPNAPSIDEYSSRGSPPLSTLRHPLRLAHIALVCALWVAACLPDPWSPPVAVCTGPRCAPTDGGATDAPPDVAADAPPASCRGQSLRGLASGIGEFGCAIRCDGAVWCWGANRYGTLGDGTITSRATPAPVHDLGGPATTLAVGFHHACAVVGGAVRCWGRNDDGQVGGGAGPDQPTPRTIAGLARPAVGLAGGGTHTCALLDDGSVWCWGGNRNGQLGDGTNVSRLAPGAVRQLGGPAAALVAGQYHSCARMVDGDVRCWGSNYLGALNDGSGNDQTRPVTMPLDDAAVSLAAISNHGCAVLAGGELWCWGFNGDGAVDRSLVNRTRPVLVEALGTSVRGVMTGNRHTCAQLEGGALRCWGSNALGQLGDGTTTRRLMPVAVQDLDGTAMLLSAGDFHTCAALPDGRARCWGAGSTGQLGTGAFEDSPVPATVLLPP